MTKIFFEIFLILQLFSPTKPHTNIDFIQFSSNLSQCKFPFKKGEYHNTLSDILADENDRAVTIQLAFVQKRDVEAWFPARRNSPRRLGNSRSEQAIPLEEAQNRHESHLHDGENRRKQRQLDSRAEHQQHIY